MSTRALIAVPDAEHGWVGTYHHSDGYPTGLGAYLHRIIEALGGDIERFRKNVIDEHPGSWSNIFDDADCYCHSKNGRAPDSRIDLYYGDDKNLNSDAEWFYLVTPDGIAVRKVSWTGSGFKVVFGEQQSLPEAVEWYVANQLIKELHASERSGFYDKTSWAFLQALPEFCK